MPIGYTNLKSVQQDRDAVREQLSPVSWAGGSLIKDPQILDDTNVVMVAGLIGAGGGDTAALEAQIASLQAQLIQSQADLAQAQAALAIAQAQNTADAITIAALQAQVTSLQSQIASLQAQVSSLQAQIATLSNRFPVLFYTNITTIDDNFYVPPSFDDVTVSVTGQWKLPTVLAYNNITTVGGGWP
jgi:multidrug efflux pump subunit AcrA (membrane-fusion protein)